MPSLICFVASSELTEVPVDEVLCVLSMSQDSDE
ncbi:hypothetical protein DFP80_10543 [Marinomonas rhizomae]|uniref:Uncharacterized protein n=1 Tax=Marinomonas rhizomae TaxID=491948 RepID=A0A366J9V3_9GAMM|nr:hypothetical protein DFP80_10543 [Marinomonas rhizomae]